MSQEPIIALLRRANQVLSALYLEEEGQVSLPQALILKTLADSGSMNQTQLRDLTGIDRSTMANVLHRLAIAGLVTNVRMEDDRRAAMVSLTRAGRKAARRTEDAMSRAQLAFLGKLTPTQIVLFRDALLKAVGSQ